MLVGCEKQHPGTQHHQRDTQDAGYRVLAVSGLAVNYPLCSHETEKETEAGNHKSERHDGDACANPSEQCALPSKEDTWIAFVHVRLIRSQPNFQFDYFANVYL